MPCRGSASTACSPLLATQHIFRGCWGRTLIPLILFLGVLAQFPTIRTCGPWRLVCLGEKVHGAGVPAGRKGASTRCCHCAHQGSAGYSPQSPFGRSMSKEYFFKGLYKTKIKQRKIYKRACTWPSRESTDPTQASQPHTWVGSSEVVLPHPSVSPCEVPVLWPWGERVGRRTFPSSSLSHLPTKFTASCIHATCTQILVSGGTQNEMLPCTPNAGQIPVYP